MFVSFEKTELLSIFKLISDRTRGISSRKNQQVNKATPWTLNIHTCSAYIIGYCVDSVRVWHRIWFLLHENAYVVLCGTIAVEYWTLTNLHCIKRNKMLQFIVIRLQLCVGGTLVWRVRDERMGKMIDTIKY